MPLARYASIYSVARSRRQQEVRSVLSSAFTCLSANPVFSSLSRYVYSSPHHYDPKFRPFNWQEVADQILRDLATETMAGISLRHADDDGSVRLFLNCKDEVVRQKVDEKWRKGPLASDISYFGISLLASHFINPTYTGAYLDALCDLFVIFGGEYGYAHHPAVRQGNNFDRAHSDDPFEPWFITWANLFGPSLVSRIGRERILSAPAYETKELADGSILLATSASPLEELDPPTQETIRRVKAHLGILSPSERATPEELAAYEARRANAQATMQRRIEDAFRQQRQPLATEMERQAEGCVEGAKRFWGKQLDFTPASLATVDEIIARGFRPDESGETIKTATQAFGAYLGEVVRRHLGGEWRGGCGSEPCLIVVQGNSRQEVHPFEAVERRFRERLQARGFTLSGWLRSLRPN